MPGTGSPAPNLGLTTGWTAHDDGWGDGYNDDVLQLDTIIMCAVETMNTVTPPTGVLGKRYVVGPSATGAWSGKDGQLVVWYNSAWSFRVPKIGWRIYNKADGKLYLYGNASTWVNEMSTGFTPFTSLTAWATSTVYTAGPPASYVSIGGSSYVCLVSHTAGTFATDLAAGKWGLVASKGDPGTNGVDGAVNSIYDLSIFVQGQPSPGQHVTRTILARPVKMSIDLAASVGSVTANPTATAAFDIKKNGTTCGTISISTGGVFTFTTVSHAIVTFAAGDLIDIYAPNPTDRTMSDIAITLVLIRL